MLAKRIRRFCRRCSLEEAIETTRIHSVAGVLRRQSGIGRNAAVPVAAPHHQRCRVIGGGAVPRGGSFAGQTACFFGMSYRNSSENVLEVNALAAAGGSGGDYFAPPRLK